MTEQLQRDIGCEVILGNAYLRACLGSVDYLRDTLDISPAWMEHGLADLRTSIPCCTFAFKSPSARASLATIRALPPAAQLQQQHARRFQKSHALARHICSTESRFVLGLVDDVIKRASKLSAFTLKHTSHMQRIVAPMHLGFPQAPGAPTHAQYADRVARVARQSAAPARSAPAATLQAPVHAPTPPAARVPQPLLHACSSLVTVRTAGEQSESAHLESERLDCAYHSGDNRRQAACWRPPWLAATATWGWPERLESEESPLTLGVSG